MKRWLALGLLVLVLALSCSGGTYVVTTSALDRLCASSQAWSLKLCWQYELLKEVND